MSLIVDRYRARAGSSERRSTRPMTTSATTVTTSRWHSHLPLVLLLPFTANHYGGLRVCCYTLLLLLLANGSTGFRCTSIPKFGIGSCSQLRWSWYAFFTSLVMDIQEVYAVLYRFSSEYCGIMSSFCSSQHRRSNQRQQFVNSTPSHRRTSTLH